MLNDILAALLLILACLLLAKLLERKPQPSRFKHPEVEKDEHEDWWY